LSGRLIGAQEEERKRIAREIHDDFSQRLAMVAIGLEEISENVKNCSSEVASQRLHNLFNRVSEVCVDLQSLSHTLHSSTLEHLGLIAGVRALCTEFTQQRGIQVDFAHEHVPQELPEDVALCFFRIAQEGLRNVKRHSGVHRAEVRIKGLGEGIHMSISDHGRGMDLNKPAPEHGLGIRSMGERVRLLGGRFELHSRPMAGTRIEAWLPLKIASAA
jgi:signal transduction histidine kinase